MRSIIALAYDIPAESIAQMVIGPSWIASERYDLEAKAENDATPTAELRVMLQTLLAERVKLKVHFETRDIPGFILVVAKNGSKLQKSTSTDRHSLIGTSGRVTGKNARIAQLISSLTLRLGRTIVDQTNLDGGYDFLLTWTPDTEDPSGPSLFTALQEQLGLKLQSEKVPTNVLIVDHIERPSGS
jgi:uncharacterized protein (TIGR03435 family)